MTKKPTLPINLMGASLSALEAIVKEQKQPKFRAKQIYIGLYRHLLHDLSLMTDLPKKLIQNLCQAYRLDIPKKDELEISSDGTRKYRFVSSDNAAYESVYIPTVAKAGRRTNTLCISSQTGCAVGCRFCYTASIKRNRDLSVGEIVGQVHAVQQEVSKLGDEHRITNIVFMGMGEPLLNYDNVVAACHLLLDPEGFNFSSRRVTVSTSGIVPRIETLGHDVPVQLAISLNASDNETRDEVMPINKRWPIEELLGALSRYPLKARRQFTIEYVLLNGVNDSIEDARRLSALLKELPVKINLLPLNDHERTPYTPPSNNRVHTFQRYLKAQGFNVLLRTPRGQDISAACGQLGETVKVTDNRGRASLPISA